MDCQPASMRKDLMGIWEDRSDWQREVRLWMVGRVAAVKVEVELIRDRYESVGGAELDSLSPKLVHVQKLRLSRGP
jgi:hypothetical protein